MKCLKTGAIAPEATAPGLNEARERLRVDKRSTVDKNDYVRHIESLRCQRSVLETSQDEGSFEGRAEERAKGMEEGLKKGAKKFAKKFAKKLLSQKIPTQQITEATGLTEDGINTYRE